MLRCAFANNSFFFRSQFFPKNGMILVARAKKNIRVDSIRIEPISNGFVERKNLNIFGKSTRTTTRTTWQQQVTHNIHNGNAYNSRTQYKW